LQTGLAQDPIGLLLPGASVGSKVKHDMERDVVMYANSMEQPAVLWCIV